ncbi:DUF1259 domain-containing protein, partial [Mesorhizobium sp.]|uniref:DUF1259 domain-containing protein n=1 Tax=Mesorhizobium sp. TaxID=1871066 RepID=UPI0025B9F1C4
HMPTLQTAALAQQPHNVCTTEMRRKAAELVPFAVAQICDLVLIASDLNSVLKALPESGIEVASMHNQPDDEPGLFSIDLWANDDCRE